MPLLFFKSDITKNFFIAVTYGVCQWLQGGGVSSSREWRGPQHSRQSVLDPSPFGSKVWPGEVISQITLKNSIINVIISYLIF